MLIMSVLKWKRWHWNRTVRTGCWRNSTQKKQVSFLLKPIKKVLALSQFKTNLSTILFGIQYEVMCWHACQIALPRSLQYLIWRIAVGELLLLRVVDLADASAPGSELRGKEGILLSSEELAGHFRVLKNPCSFPLHPAFKAIILRALSSPDSANLVSEKLR
jgi:hypothetical protein